MLARHEDVFPELLSIGRDGFGFVIGRGVFVGRLVVEVGSKQHIAIGHILACVLNMRMPHVIYDLRRHKGLAFVTIVQGEKLTVKFFRTGESGFVQPCFGLDAGHDAREIQFLEAGFEGGIEVNLLHICETFFGLIVVYAREFRGNVSHMQGGWLK